MEIPEIANEIARTAHAIRLHALEYQERKDTGRTTHMKEKMMWRRIALLEGWITRLKAELENS